MRSACPKHAARWDQAREAEKEFGFVATEGEVAAMRATAERVAAAEAAYRAELAEKRANSPFAALAALRQKE